MEPAVLVPDEAGHAPVPVEHGGEEEQRIGDIERMIADQDHPPALVKQRDEAAEVQHLMPMVACEEAGKGEKRSGHPVSAIDRDSGQRGSAPRRRTSPHRRGPAAVLGALGKCPHREVWVAGENPASRSARQGRQHGIL